MSGYSVASLATLAKRAAMSTSYKPALLKALVRTIGRGAGTTIGLGALGAEFVRLYWTQTVVFRLRQAPSLDREAYVVRRLRETAERYGLRDLAYVPAAIRRALDADMARLLTVNVLAAFHVGKPAGLGDLFVWLPGSSSLLIPEAAHRFMGDESPAIEAIANLWWARFLERTNGLAPLIIEKVERDGARRGSLARYVAMLRALDGNRCFYCDVDLVVDRPHVDHMIPWSFLLSDPPWDLVLACPRCNLAKSDTLPDRRYLDKLLLLQARRGRASLPRDFASAMLPVAEIARYYDAALSVEWPAGWRPK